MHSSRRLVAQVLLVLTGLAATACTATTVSQVENGPAQSVERSETPADPAPSEPPASENNASPQVDAAPTEAPTAAVIATGGDQPSGPIDDIRTVDFENGFTYQNAVAYSDVVVTVADGEFINGEFGDEDYFWFAVNDVQFGDLNGDGVDEAVVASGYSGGGSGFFQSIRAFELVDGVVTDVGMVSFGDRAYGGIADLIVEDGLVSVVAFTDGAGSCCPTEASVVRLTLGQHFLIQADTAPPQAWFALADLEEQELVQFAPGSSGAYLAMWGADTERTFSIEAVQDQVLTVEIVDGPAPSSFVIVDTSTGDQVGTGASAVLPSDAIYEITVGFAAVRDEPTTLNVQIDSESDTISWTPVTEQIVITNEPLVHSSLTWPSFASQTADSAAVLDANTALATMVLELDDLWIEDVTEFTEPQDDSSYEVTYAVAYARDDVVSVSFGYYDYVCCRPYPNYGPRAAVLDLRAGRIIEASEILDLDRIDQINELWLATLESQDLLPAEIVATHDRSMELFESVVVVPTGIEFGTGRNALGGATPGTNVVLTFDELGDLVRPQFLERLGR